MKTTVKCEICNKEFKSISTTHLKLHGYTFDRYKQEFPNAKIKSELTLSISGVTLDLMISRYGTEEGNRRWEVYVNRQSETNTFEYKQKKYGWNKEQFNEYNNSRAVTESNLKNKHGNEKGTDVWNKYKTRQAYAGCTLEYFIEKLGEVDGKEFYLNLNKKKAHSLEKFIKKYGEVEGEDRFIKMYSDRKLPDFTISKPHTLFLNLLLPLIPEEWIYHEGIGGKEFHHWNPILKKNYFYDFVITYPFKALIEFNGDFFHANPKMYDADDIVKIPKNYKPAKDIWEYDKHKTDLLINKGYKCKIVWEGEFKSNPDKIVNECINWLTSLIDENAND